MRYYVASRLRPDGFEVYHFGLDASFVDRVDSDWQRLYLILNRPMLQPAVTVTNL
jgi:hypothetical protein